MLLWFWNRLQGMYDAGDRSSPDMMIIRAGGEVGVYVYVPVGAGDDVDPNVHSRRVNISDEIPELRRGAEAVAVFDRLRQEGYVRAILGNAGSAVFHDLTGKGRVDIGKFPDPDRRLAEAFEAVRWRVEQDASLTTAQRADRLDSLTKVVTLLNNTAGLGQQVLDQLSHRVGGGGVG
jgi:hypothetical protein